VVRASSQGRDFAFQALCTAGIRAELDAIKFDPGDPALILAIRDALHPSIGSRAKHF
jgi:hypothetical protein